MIVDLGQRSNLSATFAPMAPHESFSGLFTLLERYTHTCVFDLLDTDRVSVRHVFSDLEDGDFEVSGVAALVEQQFFFISAAPGAKTREGKNALESLLSDIVIFYSVDRFPIRRAR